MNPLRVLYIWDADYPWDVRTEKICAALSTAGHQVHIAARNRNRLPVEAVLPEARVHRMPPWRWITRRWDNLLSFPAFLNPRWSAHLKGVIQRNDPSIIIVRDLPLCPLAIRLARARRIPVVLDMAENYAALLQDVWDTGRRQRFDILVRNPSAARRVERYCLRRVDRILVVIEESGERLRRLGASDIPIDIVSNTPPRERTALPRPEATGTGTTLAYLGIMELARGIADLIDAVRLLHQQGDQVRLLLVGGGRDLPLLEARAADLIGSGVIQFPGYIPSHAEALRIVSSADIGVIPHHASEWANTTIPNKLFDYMAAGLPVITSDNIPCARIVGNTGCGRVFRAKDPADLAEAVTRMGPEERRLMGEAGRRAIQERYNWETDTATLLAAIEGAARRAPE
jgi:glycosyltransferase involved in cell wall biosynthesis